MTQSALTLKDVSHKTGRSVSTLRVWQKDGILVGERKSDKGNSPYIFTQEAVLKAMESKGLLDTQPPNSKVQYVPSQISSFPTPEERLLQHLENDKNKLNREIQEYKEQLLLKEEQIKQLQKKIESQQEHIIALERKNISVGGTGKGIWGLLKKARDVMR